MPKPCPKEFRDDIIRVARNREPDFHLEQIAADFGISESCLIRLAQGIRRRGGDEAGFHQRPVRRDA